MRKARKLQNTLMSILIAILVIGAMGFVGKKLDQKFDWTTKLKDYWGNTAFEVSEDPGDETSEDVSEDVSEEIPEPFASYELPDYLYRKSYDLSNFTEEDFVYSKPNYHCWRKVFRNEYNDEVFSFNYVRRDSKEAFNFPICDNNGLGEDGNNISNIYVSPNRFYEGIIFNDSLQDVLLYVNGIYHGKGSNRGSWGFDSYYLDDFIYIDFLIVNKE